MVPEGWTYTALAKVVEFKNGLNFTKADQGEAIKIVGVSNFKNYSELRSTENLDVVRVAQSIRDGELLKDGDLLFVRSNGNKDLIGRCLFFPEVKERIAFSGFTIRGRVVEAQLLPEYLSNIARSPIMKQQISRNGGGTNISNLSQQILGDVAVALPPLPEQKKIAHILSTWDQAITATERLLENSQQRKKGLMQQLLNGKKRLPGFEGEWEDGHLKDIAAISKGKALSSKDLEDGVFPVVAGGKTSPYTHKNYTHDHAITVSSSGAYAGYVSYHEYKFWASDCSVVEASEVSDVEFLYHLMTWDQQRIYALQSGGAQPHVYPKDLHAIRVLIPSKKEQQAIANVLTTASKETEQLQNRVNRLKQEKKALMQQLLTGKRRVSVETEAA